MIKQEAIGLDSRQEANIYDENGMSTLQEQEKYKEGKWGVHKNSRIPNSKHPYQNQTFDTEQEAKDYAAQLSEKNPVGFTAFSLN